jgi:predicted peroxiredoxin
LQPKSLAAVACIMYDNPKQKYLNAITIATHLAVADTDATSFFVMDGVDVENKRVAKKPLTVNLPDGKQNQVDARCVISTFPGCQ